MSCPQRWRARWPVRHSPKALDRPASRSTKPSKWRCSTTTTCWPLMTTIQQSQAEEITANLRPNPDALCRLGIFASRLACQAKSRACIQRVSTNDYLKNNTEGDIGLSYLIERGKKRQHRLQAAERHHGADALAGGGQRARPLRSSTASLFVQRAARRIDARTRREGPEELSEDRRHQRTTLHTRPAPSARTTT